MLLRALTFLLLSAAIAGLAVAQPEPSPTAFEPATEADTGVPIAANGLTARDLSAADRCDPAVRRSALVTLAWQPVRAEGVTAQRVDITKFHEGFEVGRFDTSGALGADRATVTIAGPEPGILYYWRVLTQSENGWAVSEVERFDVPVCPWDPPKTDNLILRTPASSASDERPDGDR